MINKALKVSLRFPSILKKEIILPSLLMPNARKKIASLSWGPPPRLGRWHPPITTRWLTTQRIHRLVSLAVRTVTLPGATSGGACSVWITREGWLRGLGPTTFTCLIRNLQQKDEAQREAPRVPEHPKGGKTRTGSL